MIPNLMEDFEGDDPSAVKLLIHVPIAILCMSIGLGLVYFLMS